MIRRVAPVAVLLSLASVLGCGARATSPTPSAQIQGGGSESITAAAAQRAGEPRTSDATAAHSDAPLPPTPVQGGGMMNGVAWTPVKAAKSESELPKKITARHVLVQWMGSDRAPASVVRSREQAYSVVQEVLKRARAKDDFARLAVEYSDEPNAGARGGSLGRFGRGQMVAAFDDVAFRLEVGEISDIVETPFGFHVIQRTE